jgi:hypothetical protein
MHGHTPMRKPPREGTPAYPMTPASGQAGLRSYLYGADSFRTGRGVACEAVDAAGREGAVSCRIVQRMHHSGRREDAGAARHPVSSGARWFYLAVRAGLAGHILWYQMDPSLTWLPFLRILSLHLGQVPIPVSFID